MNIILVFLKKIAAFIMTAAMLVGFGPNFTSYYTPKDEDACTLKFAVLAAPKLEGNNLETYGNYDKVLKGVGHTFPKNDALVLIGDNTMNGQDIESMLSYGHSSLVHPAKNIFPSVGSFDIHNDPELLTQRFIEYGNSFCDLGIDKPYYCKVLNGCYFIFLAPELNTAYSADITMSDEQYEFVVSKLAEAEEKDAFTFIFANCLLPGISTQSEPGALMNAIKNKDKVVVMDFFISRDVGWWTFHDYDGVHTVNLPKCSERMVSGDGIGAEVEVYPDKVLVRMRDFAGGKWIEGAETEYPITF